MASVSGGKSQTPVSVQYQSAINRGLSDREAVREIKRNTGMKSADIRSAVRQGTYTNANVNRALGR